MRRAAPLGIEPYLRDQRAPSLLYLGLSGCAEDLSAPSASLAARKDREAALLVYSISISLLYQVLEL
jgi:hypothetical protein